MSKAMKITDKRETQKKKKERKRTTGTEAIAKGWEINDFCWAFKLGFLQLICKASLIFKSNLELPLLITLKERELYESKHVVVECRCLKIWEKLSKLCKEFCKENVNIKLVFTSFKIIIFFI